MATTAPVLCTLGIKTEQPKRFRCDTHCEETLRRLQSRLDLCDVVLIAGSSGKRIAAHRFFLIACSEYFSDLFSGPIGGGQQEVTIDDINGDAMEKLINYCYTGILDIEGDMIESLLTAANHLRLEKAVEGCCEFLQQHLQSSNSLDVTFYADQLNLESLLHTTRKFICENFKEISNQPKFLLINAKQLSELIACDDLCAFSEELVFDVIMKWIEYEPETRRKHFSDFLAQMRLSRLSHSFLLAKVEPLCNEMISLKLVTNALKSHPVTTDLSQPSNSLSKPVMKDLLIIGKITSGRNLYITSYNLQTKITSVCNTPIKGPVVVTAALMDDKLIIVARHKKYTPFNTASSLNLTTMSSIKMASLGTAKKDYALAVLKGSVYAIGGCRGKHSLNSVEKYDFVCGTWISVASMEESRKCPGVAVLSDLLYVSGGYDYDLPLDEDEEEDESEDEDDDDDEDLYLPSMECYDPVRGVWSSLAPMQVGRHSHGFAAYKGYLFVFGGESFDTDELPVERYDPQTNSWTDISSSHNFSGFTTCTSLGSDLFIYNESKIYMIDNDSSCQDHLEFREVPHDYHDDFGQPIALVPYDRCNSIRL